MKHRYIEAEWINALMRTFANFGLNSHQIVEGLSGFEGGKMVAGYRLEVGAARQMWHRADELAQDPLLGVKIGSSQDYRAIGVLAPVIWHSPSVRLALYNLARFQTLISESGSYQITEGLGEGERGGKEQEIHCEYVAVPSSVPVNVHQILAVITGTVGIIQAISNNTVKVKRLYAPDSLNASLLSKHLACDVVSQDRNFTICFASEQFDESLLGCDDHLYQINLAYAEELLRTKRAGLAIIDSVKELIEHCGFSTASINDVEARLELHKRTLQRSLFEQGTSFRQLKEEVLKERAVNLLVAKKVEIEFAASYLGYSEPSAFHRAFKSWFGVTPKQFCSMRHY